MKGRAVDPQYKKTTQILHEWCDTIINAVAGCVRVRDLMKNRKRTAARERFVQCPPLNKGQSGEDSSGHTAMGTAFVSSFFPPAALASSIALFAASFCFSMSFSFSFTSCGLLNVTLLW